MARKPLVIYHKNCSDGMAAAWTFWNIHKDAFEYSAASYNGKVPDVLDRDVYLVDFSYKRNILELIMAYSNKIVLLDHHQSAIEELWDIEEHNFDMSRCSTEKSGAMLAWEYNAEIHHMKTKPPHLLLYIQDRDLWKFELPNSREINAALKLYDQSFEVYDRLMRLTKAGLKGLIKEGTLLLNKQAKDIESILRYNTRVIKVGDHDVPFINSSMYRSELGSAASVGFPFAAIYSDSKEYREISLRSQPEGLDVSEIAKKFGGGGHKHAAGFKVKRDHFLAKC